MSQWTDSNLAIIRRSLVSQAQSGVAAYHFVTSMIYYIYCGHLAELHVPWILHKLQHPQHFRFFLAHLLFSLLSRTTRSSPYIPLFLILNLIIYYNLINMLLNWCLLMQFRIWWLRKMLNCNILMNTMSQKFRLHFVPVLLTGHGEKYMYPRWPPECLEVRW